MLKEHLSSVFRHSNVCWADCKPVCMSCGVIIYTDHNIYILLILLYHNILYMTRLCFIHIHQSHWDSSSSEPVASPDGWGIQIRLAMISLSQFWGLLETFGNKAIFVLGESSLRIACRLQIKLLEPAKTQTWFVRADLGCIDRRSHPSQLLTQTDANLQKL